MSFHDDSHILSELGILDSNERSPKRELSTEPSSKDRQKFTDIKLAPTLSDSEDEDNRDDDEDVLFDRNNLLSSTRRQKPSFLRGREDNQAARYFLLCLLFLTAGLVSTPNAISYCSMTHEVFGCLWICVGILLGCYLVKMIAFKENFMLCLLLFLLILLINTFLVFNFAFVFFIRGFFIGAMLYGGSLAWFAVWRKDMRRLLILLMIFSAGEFTSMMSKTDALKDASESVVGLAQISSRSISDLSGRFRREANSTSNTSDKNLLPFSQDLDNSTAAVNFSEENVKKPEVATGSEQKTKSKTEENAEREKEVQRENEKNEVKGSTTVKSTSTSTTTTTTSSTTTTAPTITTTTSPTTTTSTEAPKIPLTIRSIDSASSDKEKETSRLEMSTTTSPPYPETCPDQSLFLSRMIPSNDEASSAGLRMFIAIVSILYAISYLFCCLPCGLKPDRKIVKLESESTVGLGMRLRISTAAIQTLVGLMQQLIHFHSWTISENAKGVEKNHMAACASVFATSVLLVILGRKIGTLSFVFFSCFVLILGQAISLGFSNSTYGMSLSSSGLFAFWVSLFLTIESSLRARSTVQLAYFLIAWVVGRILACLFASRPSFLGFTSAFTLLSTIAICALLFYASKLLTKAKRLKEILDNSSSPIAYDGPSASGEYIPLTAQDLNDDEEYNGDDDADNSSMDLDFDLREMLAQPAPGSRSALKN